MVGPGSEAAQELRALRRYRRRHRPLLVGVDAGGDVLRAAGLSPDLLVGDPVTMSDEALRAAKVVCLRAEAEGLERVHDLAVPVHLVATRAAGEDLAVLLAHHGGAAAVVLVGVPRDLLELLDRGRSAAASTPLTRVAAGAGLLSARTAVALTPRRSRALPLLCLLLAAALAVTVGVAHDELWRTWRDLGR